MIARNFIYCRPESEASAADFYARFRNEGKTAMYYGGGSEIITMCTAGSIAPDAVIDLKGIPSLNAMHERGGFITIGAACPLDMIRTRGIYPLLGETAGRISDHTNQCRITLGGNLCGSIIYREAVLPLLLADSLLELFGPGGRRMVSMHEVFDGHVRLNSGEFIVSARIDGETARSPHAHIKRTFAEKIGYPAVTAAALLAEGKIRAAFSGICAYPFRSPQIEKVINDRLLPPKARAEAAALALPEPPCTDCEGSGEYRLNLFKLTLEEIIEMLDTGQYPAGVQKHRKGRPYDL